MSAPSHISENIIPFHVTRDVCNAAAHRQEHSIAASRQKAKRGDQQSGKCDCGSITYATPSKRSGIGKSLRGYHALEKHDGMAWPGYLLIFIRVEHNRIAYTCRWRRRTAELFSSGTRVCPAGETVCGCRRRGLWWPPTQVLVDSVENGPPAGGLAGGQGGAALPRNAPHHEASGRPLGKHPQPLSALGH